jgi:hypothetical protein
LIGAAILGGAITAFLITALQYIWTGNYDLQEAQPIQDCLLDY